MLHLCCGLNVSLLVRGDGGGEGGGEGFDYFAVIVPTSFKFISYPYKRKGLRLSYLVQQV